MNFRARRRDQSIRAPIDMRIDRRSMASEVLKIKFMDVALFHLHKFRSPFFLIVD